MSEKVTPFVVTDRRKFTLDGELNPEFIASEQEHKHREETAEPTPASQSPTPVAAAPAEAEAAGSELGSELDPELPPPPTAEQMEQSKLAFDATAERLDTAIRATNPGMEHLPEMNFERLVQSLYMTAIMQLGGGTPDGQKPQVDLMGARQSIDMLNVVAERTRGNLVPDETRLIDSALFELRLAFLELTQALARSAAARNPGAPGTPQGPPPGFGIVR
jgi:Domain of unknown function (DUF1844)